MRIRSLLVLLLALVLVAGSCGGDDGGADQEAGDDSGDDSGDTGDTGDDSDDDGLGDDSGDDLDDDGLDDDGLDDDSGDDLDDGDDGDDAPDPCADVTLEETEIGVSADTITVVAMADVGSELAPGLFQGALDGVNAWAETVNAAGGLACRQVEVVEADSAINPTETTNGYLRGCESALAMVGTYALFALDVEDQTTCADQAGAATGIPDFAGLANNPPQQCSPNTFTVNTNNGSCPYDTGVRDWSNQVGPAQWVLENDPLVADGANGIFIIPGDLPTTINSTVPGVIAQRDALGVGIDGLFGVSGSAAQSEFGAYIAAAQTAGSNWLQSGSDDNSMLKLLREATAQGFDISEAVKFCSLACYTDNFRSDPVAEATYVWSATLPFGERDTNEELATMLDAIGQDFPQSWAITGWASGRLLERVVNEIVATDGPNGITRARLLETVSQITDFDANGMLANIDFVNSRYAITPCFVLLQVFNGNFGRVHPQEPGTFDCSASNVAPLTLDGLATFSDFS